MYLKCKASRVTSLDQNVLSKVDWKLKQNRIGLFSFVHFDLITMINILVQNLGTYTFKHGSFIIHRSTKFSEVNLIQPLDKGQGVGERTR